MQRYLISIYILLALTFIAISVYAENSATYLYDDFNNLYKWKPLYFKKIENHTDYSIKKEGESSYLKAVSNASASGIVLKREFNVFDFPKIKWRWKVGNIIDKGDAGKRSGDDYPMRIYIIFKYDPETSSLAKKIRYGLIKNIYGEYPPDSSLNYIWANRKHNRRILTNTYAADAKMIVLQEGINNVGKWIEEEVDIIKDYHEAFRKDPPAVAGVAIMSDSDNTGERAVSYLDYIVVYR